MNINGDGESVGGVGRGRVVVKWCVRFAYMWHKQITTIILITGFS